VADHALRLRPGTLVVLEGLDRTGKSTQMSALRSQRWADPVPAFAHMPSGMSALTQAVYELIEGKSIASPLARQLLHLACHAENLGLLRQARRERAVVLDRWWWSTVAYGWHAGHLDQHGVDKTLFRELIGTVWAGQEADVVFLFTEPHESDDHNRAEVSAAYKALAEQHHSLAVHVPKASPAATTALLLDTMRERAILES